MTSPVRALVLGAAILALVFGAGCGGSDTQSANEYVDAINKAQTDFANSVQKIGSSASGTTAAEKAQNTFASLEKAIDKVVADLKAVDPPEKVQDLHNQLVAQLTQFHGQVKTAGDSLSSGDQQAIVKAQSKFAASASTLGTQISQTIDAINKKLQG